MAESINQFSKIGPNITDNFVNYTQKINFEQKYFIFLSIYLSVYQIFNFIKYLIVLLVYPVGYLYILLFELFKAEYPTG
jgi:hypothetical protein